MTDASVVEPEGPPASNRLATAVRLVGPTTVLTALLYYYGYVSLRAYYAYFGISLSVLDLRPDSYAVRTPDALFKPVSVLALLLIGVFVAHLVLGRRLPRAGPATVRRLASALAAVALVLGVVAVLGTFATPWGLVSPLCLVVSAATAEYSLWLLKVFGAPRPSVAALLRSGEDLRRGLVIALVAIGLFWAVNEIAHDRGEELARLTEETLPVQPQAVVFSQQDLGLGGPGVVTVPVVGARASAYAFRTNGLRPLLFANHRWFLLPAGWSRGNRATVIVLEEDAPRLRVELAPGAALPPAS